MSILQHLSSEFNLETCHQVSANVIHESIVGVTRDIQVEEERDTTWNNDNTLCEFRDNRKKCNVSVTLGYYIWVYVAVNF